MKKKQTFRKPFFLDVKWEALNTFGDSRIRHVRMQVTSVEHNFVFEFFVRAHKNFQSGYCMKNEKHQNNRRNFVFDVKWEALNTFGDSRIWHVRMQLTSLNHIFVFEFFSKVNRKIGKG